MRIWQTREDGRGVKEACGIPIRLHQLASQQGCADLIKQKWEAEGQVHTHAQAAPYIMEGLPQYLLS